MSDPISYWQGKREEFDSELLKAKSRQRMASHIRLLVFIIGAGLSIYLWTLDWVYGAVGTPIFITGFLFTVKWHFRLTDLANRAAIRFKISEEEMDRLNYRFQKLNAGEKFIDPDHSFTSDLDIFGARGLFAWLSRTATGFGEEILASWLSAPAKIPEVRMRQDAVRELASQEDWRMKFQVAGRLHDGPKLDRKFLKSWIDERSGMPKWMVIPSFALPVITFALLLLAGFGVIGWMYFWIAIGVHGAIVYRTKDISAKAYESTDGRNKMLFGLQEMTNLVEDKAFESIWLKVRGDRMIYGGSTASLEILKLARIFNRLQMRLHGLMYILLNILVFWDNHWILALDRWKEKNAENVIEWFKILGEFEALSSLAATYSLRPGWTFPEIVEGENRFECRNLGHPLIHPDTCIRNDFNLNDKSRIALVTGSNMSGKSTFLRTVGVNAVLGFAGAPVCADDLKLSIFDVFTSMRTEDSLAESVSSFYAELQRIKKLIDITDEGKRQVLFLLDEILKGTNSNDRHSGAKALLLQLDKAKAFGLVSTHDLDLTKPEVGLPDSIFNCSFDSDLNEEGELVFSYKKKDGPAESFNATILMKTMGIRIE